MKDLLFQITWYFFCVILNYSLSLCGFINVLLIHTIFCLCLHYIYLLSFCLLETCLFIKNISKTFLLFKSFRVLDLFKSLIKCCAAFFPLILRTLWKALNLPSPYHEITLLNWFNIKVRRTYVVDTLSLRPLNTLLIFCMAWSLFWAKGNPAFLLYLLQISFYQIE